MPKPSKICDKIIQDYTFPHISSGDDSGSIMVKRKAKQDASGEIPLYPDPVYRSPPKPVKLPIPNIPRCLLDIDPEINTDFKENSTFQEGVISETYQRTDKTYFREPQELESPINRGRQVQEFLPKEADIDKILKTIQRKVLKGMHISAPVKEIQRGYLISPYFKDLYLYSTQNELPSTKTAICKVQMLAEKYALVDSLSFRLVTTPEKTALLAIPVICIDKIITLYHSSLFAGHQGIIKNIFDYRR